MILRRFGLINYASTLKIFVNKCYTLPKLTVQVGTSARKEKGLMDMDHSVMAAGGRGYMGAKW